VSFIVKGVLARDAEHRVVGPDSAAALILRIDAGGTYEVEVRRQMGQNHRGCEELARTLRKGQPVEALGVDMALRMDHGDALHVIRGAHRIDVNGRELL
jgi:hypothetical protein